MPVGHFQAAAEVIASPKFVVSKRLKLGLLVAGAFVVLLGVFLSLPRWGTFNAGSGSGSNAAAVKPDATPSDVPIAVGRDAWQAVTAFKAYGFNVSPTDLSRDYIYGDDVELKTKLKGLYVCYQSIVPGVPLEPGKDILFTLGPGCKAKRDPMVSGRFATATGVWSPEVTGETDALDNVLLDGWVVGYGDAYQPEKVTLLTLYGEVSIDLDKIEPLDSWCNSDKTSDDALIEAAMTARNTLLPLESPVRVVLAAGPQKAQGYFHRIGADGQLADGALPANSVNELLVKDGSWIPDRIFVDESSNKVAPAKRAWVLASLASSLNAEEATYLKLLVAAANLQKNAPTSVMVECLASAQTYWLTVELPNIKSSSGGSGGGSVSGGVSVGRCWVNPYIRNGHVVRGYYRRC